MYATDLSTETLPLTNLDSIETLQRMIARRADVLRAQPSGAAYSDLECWLLAEQEVLPSTDTETFLIAS